MRGGQRQVLLLLNALREKGHSSTLLARYGSPLWRAAMGEGFSLFPGDAEHVWKLSSQAELVHAHDARAHTLAALFARTPFVVSRRVAFPVGRSFPSRWKYRRARRYLAVSQFVAGELASAGVARDKIDVVYDAVSAAPSTVWKPNGPAVALPSRDPQKGRDLVEQASALAGIAVDFADDLEGSLRGASMFVYITRSEGLGSAALLAMNMGVPVIASHTGGLAEVVEEGVSGLLVANNAPEIARAMNVVRRDWDLARKLIEGAHRAIAERFTVSHMVGGALASYRRALD